MRLIINADDFGISKSVNSAIVQAFEEGLITSTTIMVNMNGFEEACQLINNKNLHGKVGIHLNLIEGYPVTERMSLCKRFCDDNGMFKGKRATVFKLNDEEKRAVSEEFQGQIDRLISRGIIPTHIDSHFHYHTEWAIGREVMKLAHRNGIKAIRLARNCGEGANVARKLYKKLYNFRLSIHGLSSVKYFGSIRDIMKINRHELYDIEIMVHPDLNKEKELIDLAHGEKLHILIENVKALLPGANLSSYSGEVE